MEESLHPALVYFSLPWTFNLIYFYVQSEDKKLAISDDNEVCS